MSPDGLTSPGSLRANICLPSQGLLRNGGGLTTWVTVLLERGSLSPRQSDLPLLPRPFPCALHCIGHGALWSAGPFPVVCPICPSAAVQKGQKRLRERGASPGSHGTTEQVVPQSNQHPWLQPYTTTLPTFPPPAPRPRPDRAGPRDPPFTQQLPCPPPLLASAQHRESRRMDRKVATEPWTQAGTDTGVPFYY